MMEASMTRIRRVEVEGFRSIRHLTFEPRALCALVGPNNAGKSNILSAIDLVIGRRWPTEGSFTEDDCYGLDPREGIRIRIEFSASDDHGNEIDVGLQFARAEDGAYRLFHRFNEGPWSPYTRRDTREACPLIRLGIDRSIRQQQATNRWTLLGRLLLEINAQLRRSPERMAEFEETMAILRDDILASVPMFQALAETLRVESARQLQRSEDEIAVELALHDPWNFYRTLQLVIEECGMRFRAEQMGMGLQSSLTIALLRAYARIAKEGRAVIAIEEPELFLHPLARRQFYNLLREMADGLAGQEPMQILYATHSGEFVDFEHFDEICLVRKEIVAEEWTTVVHQATFNELIGGLEAWGVVGATVDSLRARLKATFDPARTAALFADAALLVEGPTEELAIPVYAAASGIDLDGLNIAVVSAGGKTNIPTLLNVFRQLDIPCYVMFDGDAHEAEDRAKVELAARACGVDIPDPAQTVITEAVAVWEKDFESLVRAEVEGVDEVIAEARAELGRKVGKPLIARFCALHFAERGNVPPSLQDVLSRVVALRNRTVSTSPTRRQPGAPSERDTGPADDEIPF
jgi:putative ATP-dependent endonuclease of OLD family